MIARLFCVCVSVPLFGIVVEGPDHHSIENGVPNIMLTRIIGSIIDSIAGSRWLEMLPT